MCFVYWHAHSYFISKQSPLPECAVGLDDGIDDVSLSREDEILCVKYAELPEGLVVSQGGATVVTMCWTSRLICRKEEHLYVTTLTEGAEDVFCSQTSCWY